MRLQEKRFSSKTQLQMYATSQLNRIQTTNAVFINTKEHSPERTATSKGFSMLFSRRAPCTVRCPQNDKQKAQTKLSFHDVSAAKTRESVNLENQNVTELC